MKHLKLETCPECGAKREVPVTCADCASCEIGPYGLNCLKGKSGFMLCKEFKPSPGVEIVKQKDGGAS